MTSTVPVRRAIPCTRFASFQTRNAKLRGHSVVGIFQSDLQVITQICAALRGGATGASATTAKDIVEPKKIPEDVFDTAETGRAPCLAAATGNSCMPKVIVALPLGRISKHTVGF